MMMMISKRLLQLYLTCSGGVYLTVQAFVPTTSWQHPYAARARSSTSAFSSEIRSISQQQQQSSSSSSPPTTNATILIPSFAPIDETSSYPSLLHKIHIRSILSDTEAATCLDIATKYAVLTKAWDQPDFQRHASYATCDFAVDECEPLQDYLQEIDFDTRILSLLSDLYDVPVQGLSYLDHFCAHYQAKSSSDDLSSSLAQTMDRLEEHRDGSLLSYTLLLNSPDDFDGGGTVVDALKEVPNNSSEPWLYDGVIRLQRAGDASLHSGKVLHGASVVTKGKRTVLVGFIEVAEWFQRPGALSLACRDFGRMDVATSRYKRQQEKTSNGEKGWLLNNQRWLPKGGSVVRGYCPAFSSVARRADVNFQRRVKLKAEDILLRSILLDESEREDSSLWSDQDITIL
jgi:hypothetical protein